MFAKKPNQPHELDEPIKKLLETLANVNPETKEYAQITKQLEKLYKLKQLEKPEGVSADTIALIGGNLLGILIIVGHERAHIVTSKALGFIRQLK